MMYFLDFDYTIFNSGAFIAHLLERPGTMHLRAHPEEELAGILNELSIKGDLAFEPDELKPFVYPDVPEFLRMAGNEAVILTFGNPALQRMKITNALAGIPRVSALYTDAVRKGEFMKDRIGMYGNSIVFVDDRAVELADMAAHCPQVRLFEMRRDDAPGDGRWPVIRSLIELP